MDLAEIKRISDAATDRFRLETLPTYLVPQEEEEFGAWKRGQHALPDVEDDPWLRHIRDTTAEGMRWWRARILDYPLTEYSQYELHGYQGNAAAGEDIYVADRGWSRDLAGLHDDFWIFDHEIVVRMVYDAEGHFLRPELVSDPSGYLAIRATVLKYTVPLVSYLADHEPRLIA